MKQKTNDNKSTREQASKWFASKSYIEQHEPPQTCGVMLGDF